MPKFLNRVQCFVELVKYLAQFMPKIFSVPKSGYELAKRPATKPDATSCNQTVVAGPGQTLVGAVAVALLLCKCKDWLSWNKGAFFIFILHTIYIYNTLHNIWVGTTSSSTSLL